MAPEPFQQRFRTQRAVRPPAGLTGEKRAAFAQRVRAALDRLTSLGGACDTVLGPTGPLREREGLLVFEHDPIRPCAPGALADDTAPDIDALWWITWSALRVLAAGEAQRVVHGGLQPRALGVDRAGRIRLADFGLAPIAESTGGRDCYQRAACAAGGDDDPPAGGLSAVWMMPADDPRPDGWISPYFAPEILAATARPNPISDQFSLGIMLYQLAAGVHPRGADFSDPDLFGYFVPEMLPLEEQVSGWAASFERAAAGRPEGRDEAIAAWGALTARLLAQEVEDRFGSFAEALRVAEDRITPLWHEADAALREAAGLLAAGEYDAFLAAAGPWAERDELPALWRGALTAGIAQVERDRARAAARTTLAVRIDEANRILDGGDPHKARAILDEIAAEPDVDESVRHQVAELRRLCDEHEHLIARRADELALANIAAAREAMHSGEFDVARVILTGMCEDDLTGAGPRAQARALLADIDEREQSFARQQAALDAATAAVEQGHLAQAIEQLHTLTHDATLAPPLRERAEKLLAQAEQARRRRADAERRVAQAREALDRADPKRAEEALAFLPADIDDAEIRRQRDALLEACTRIRDWRARLDAAEVLLRSGSADEALAAARALLDEQPAEPLAAAAGDLAERCERVIAQMAQAHVEEALESLQHAEQAMNDGDIERCRRALSMVLPLAEKLDPAHQQRAERLAEQVRASEAAQQQIDAAHGHLRADALEQAREALDEIEPTGLPESVAARVRRLSREIEQRRRALDTRLAGELAAALDRVTTLLRQGEIERATEVYEQARLPDTMPDDLRDRYDAAGAELDRQRSLGQVLRAAEAALQRGSPELATRRLEEIAPPAQPAEVAELPEWAAARVATLRQQIEQAAKRQAEQELREARESVEQARQAVTAGDVDAASRLLDAARARAHRHTGLLAECDEIDKTLDGLRRALPRLVEAEEALQRNEVVAAERLLATLLRRAPLPGPLQQRLQDLQAGVEAAVATHRARLDAELESFAALVKKRSRRVRATAPRIIAIETDGLATPHHKRRAADLLAEAKTAPPARRGRAGGVAAIVLIGAGAALAWHWSRSGRTSTPVANPAPQAPPRRAQLPPGQPPAPTVADAPPGGATAEEPPSPPAEQPARPSAPPWPAALETQTLTAPGADELGALFGRFVSRVDLRGTDAPHQQLAGLVRALRIDHAAGADTFTLTITPRGGAADISAGFGLVAKADKWSPAEQNGEALRTLTRGVTDAVRRICTQAVTDLEQAWAAGQLVRATERLAAMRPLGPILDRQEFETAGRRLRAIEQHLPPRWRPVAGFDESPDRDPDTGYPRYLDHAGRRLVLVNIPPGDPIWQVIREADAQAPASENAAGYELAQYAHENPQRRPWYLFYLEAREGTELVDRDPAATAGNRGEDLPTVSEWLVVAMRGSRAPRIRGMIGGAWEWCRQNGQTWVCGGCDALHGRFLPPPPPDAPPRALWQWLNHPLVSQPRGRGDGLATVRGVLRPQ